MAEWIKNGYKSKKFIVWNIGSFKMDDISCVYTYIDKILGHESLFKIPMEKDYNYVHVSLIMND